MSQGCCLPLRLGGFIAEIYSYRSTILPSLREDLFLPGTLSVLEDRLFLDCPEDLDLPADRQFAIEYFIELQI